jgi:hypothetical protein
MPSAIMVPGPALSFTASLSFTAKVLLPEPGRPAKAIKTRCRGCDAKSCNKWHKGLLKICKDMPGVYANCGLPDFRSQQFKYMMIKISHRITAKHRQKQRQNSQLL